MAQTKKKQEDKKLPETQTIKTDRGNFIIGRPLMKHRVEIAKIINGLMKIEESMGSDKIEKLAKKVSLTTEELIMRVQQDNITPEIQAELDKLEEQGSIPPFEDIAAIQLETVYVCMKETPFEWDGTKEDLEEKLDYGDGFLLFVETAPYIMACVQTSSKRKK